MTRGALSYRLQHQPLAAVGILLLVLFVAMALLASMAAPYDPAAIDLNHRLVSPGHGHWFGTDELGRDILSRILYGARISLIVAVSVVSIVLRALRSSRARNTKMQLAVKPKKSQSITTT